MTNNRRLRSGRIALLVLAVVVTMIAAALAATRSAPGATRTAAPAKAVVAHHAAQGRWAHGTRTTSVIQSPSSR